MKTADHYRARAKEMAELAARAPDAELASFLRELQATYERLAEIAEKDAASGRN